MKTFSSSLAPAEIIAVCGGEYQGESGITLQSVADPAQADASSIVFLEQEKYFEAVRNSRAALVFCLPETAAAFPGRNLLLHPQPYFALMRLVSWWLERSAEKPPPGIHPTAIVDPTASMGTDVHIGAYVVIGRNCRIGNGARIEANCVLGDEVGIGAQTLLYPHVVVYSGCEVGHDCIVHSGAVIGADGFGFILMDGIQHKIPQIGNVVIGSFVEIGANTTIDRGTLSSTTIGDGTKIDNSVQIGHNCVIGKHSILCAQVGLAGSTVVGDYVYLAGQVGAAGHISIGDKAMVGAQSGISGDVPSDARYLGYPAMDAGAWKRIRASEKHLPEIYREFLKQQKAHGNKE